MSARTLVIGLVAHALQAALIMTAGLILPRLANLRDPALKLLFYRWVAVLALVGPWVSFAGVAGMTDGLLPELPLETVVVVLDEIPESESGVWPVLLAAITALTAARLAWLGAGILTLTLWRRRSRPARLSPLLTAPLLERFRSRPQICYSLQVQIPASFGWIRPTILLPESFGELGEAQQRAVLCHEWIHLERRDWPAVLAEELIRSVFWFHPLLPMLFERIHLSREQLVDQQVVACTGERGLYLRTLQQLALTFRQASLAPTLSFIRANHLRQRVASLTQEVCMHRSRQVVVLGVLMSVSAVFAVATEPSVSVAGFPRPAAVEGPVGILATGGPGLEVMVPSGEPTVSSASQSEEKKGAVNISEESEVKTRLVKRVNPKYPPEAKEKGITGDVICRAKVGKDGKAKSVEVTQTAHELLNSAAVEAVSQWEWEPVKKNGEPVEFQISVTIRFQLLQ